MLLDGILSTSTTSLSSTVMVWSMKTRTSHFSEPLPVNTLSQRAARDKELIERETLRTGEDDCDCDCDYD